MLFGLHKNTIVGLGVALIAVVFYTMIGAGVAPHAREHDFLSFYTGAKLVLEGKGASLYDFELQTATEKALAPDAPEVPPFIRPPFYALLLAPLALLPLKAAFVTWVGLQIVGLLGFWVWAYRRFGPDSLVYCAFFMPTARGIMHGQDCVTMLLLMLGATLAFERRKDGLTGALVGLTLIKFHLLLLLPVVMLTRKRWKMLAGYSAVAAIEVAVSLAMVGLGGVRQYFDLITRRDLDALNPSPDMMVNIHSIAANLGIDAVWFKPMLFAAVLIVVLTANRNWFWAAALGSLLLPPHTYVYDLAILLIPGLILVFTEAERQVRVAAAVAMAPIPYLFTFFERPLAVIPSLAVVALLTVMTVRVQPRCETITASP